MAHRTGEAIYLSSFLKQLSRLSTDFLILPAERIDAALRDALHEIGALLGFDTFFVVSISEDEHAEIRSFWRKDTLSIAPLEIFLSRKRGDYATSFTLLSPEKLVQLDPNQLPSGSLENRLAELLKLESMTLVRLESPEQTLGLLCGGMSKIQHSLSDIERRLLSMTGNIVANLLLRRQEQNRTKKAEAELHAARLQLATLTQNDPLTELSNARVFHNTLEYELRRAQRAGSPIALVLLEIDYFAEYCNRLGNDAGDEALCAIAQKITRLASRSSDLAAYLNGQRFALLLPDTTSEGALTITRHLHSSIAAQNLANRERRISASIALLRYEKCHHSDPPPLLNQAEQTLNQAQRHGGDCIEIFDAAATQ